MPIDDPDEVERAATALRTAANRIGQEEQRVRSLMSILRFKSIDPGSRVASDVEGAVRQLLSARTTLDDTAKKIARTAQELRNKRIR